jgi:hypothetical protein
MNGLELRFIHQAQGRVVQLAECCLVRFKSSELNQIAALQEFAEALLLVRRQQIGRLQFQEKFFCGAFRRVKVEPLLQIRSCDAGDLDAKETGVVNQRQRRL